MKIIISILIISTIVISIIGFILSLIYQIQELKSKKLDKLLDYLGISVLGITFICICLLLIYIIFKMM